MSSGWQSRPRRMRSCCWRWNSSGESPSRSATGPVRAGSQNRSSSGDKGAGGLRSPGLARTLQGRSRFRFHCHLPAKRWTYGWLHRIFAPPRTGGDGRVGPPGEVDRGVEVSADGQAAALAAVGPLREREVGLDRPAARAALGAGEPSVSDEQPAPIPLAPLAELAQELPEAAVGQGPGQPAVPPCASISPTPPAAAERSRSRTATRALCEPGGGRWPRRSYPKRPRGRAGTRGELAAGTSQRARPVRCRNVRVGGSRRRPLC